jgi:hypothetical protein
MVRGVRPARGAAQAYAACVRWPAEKGAASPSGGTAAGACAPRERAHQDRASNAPACSPAPIIDPALSFSRSCLGARCGQAGRQRHCMRVAVYARGWRGRGSRPRRAGRRQAANRGDTHAGARGRALGRGLGDGRQQSQGRGQFVATERNPTHLLPARRGSRRSSQCVQPAEVPRG